MKVWGNINYIPKNPLNIQIKQVLKYLLKREEEE